MMNVRPKMPVDAAPMPSTPRQNAANLAESVRGETDSCSRIPASPRTANDLQQTISELRASEDMFRLLVERVQDYAIFMLDPRGYVTTWNEGAKRIKGYTSDEIIGKHFSCFYVPADVASHKPQRELEIAAATGRYVEEGPRLRKDGSTFWASIVITALHDEAQCLRGYAKVTQNITLSKQAEENSRLMVNLALNAMVMVDERGKIVQVNSQAETLFGYTAAQLLGQPVELLVPDRFKAEHPANLARYIGDPIVRPMGAGRDLYGRRSDGSEFPIEIGLHPIDVGGTRQVLGSIVDITERKRAEDQARKYLSELAHVARLSTMGQMVSELAHEVNQPLAAAANYARACVSFARAEKGATVDQLVGWMEKAAGQIDRTLEIVNRLAAFVKKEPAHRTLININRVIENIVTLSVPGVPAATAASERLNPILDLDESLPLVSADRIQIEQVLLNLIRNGVEAMQEVPPAAARLVIRSARQGDCLRVDVSDNGKGIPTAQRPQLFGPFFTTKPTGMGLGLSISRSIVENHRGQITVDSELGRGSTFSFTLPVPQRGDSP
jgi:two-component system sensor kinase FixL